MSSPEQPPQGLSTYEAMVYQRQQLQKQQEQQAARDRATQDIAEAQAQFRQDQAAAQAKGQNLTSQTITKVDGGPTTIESNFEYRQNPSGLGRSVGTVTGSYIDLTPQNVVDYQEAKRAQFNAHEQSKAQGQYTQDYFNSPVLGSQSRLDVFRSQQAQANRELYPVQYSRRYSVDLQDSISGVTPGKMHYQVNIEDRLSGGPYRYERQPGVNDVQQQAQPFKIEGGFIENFENYFGNIVEFGKGAGKLITTGKYQANQKPEVEGQTYSALTSGQASSVKGGFTLVNPTSVKALADVGKGIIENPIGAAGSLAGTALTFGLTAGASSVGKIAKAGIAARSSRSFEAEVLPQLRQTGKTVVDVEKGVLGIGKEGEAFRFSVAGAPEVSRTGKVSREYFHSTPLSKVEKGDLLSGDPSKLTAYYQKVIKINENEYPFGAVRQTPSKASSQVIPTLSGNPKDVMEPLRGIRPTGSEKIEIPASKGFDVSQYPTYDKIVATSEKLSDSQVKGLVKPDAGRNFLGLGDNLTKDVFRIEARPGKPSTPFSFGSDGASQQAITRESLKSLGIDVSKSAGGGSNSLIGDMGKLAGPSRAFFTQNQGKNAASLGFGGATGAERKRRKSDVFQSVFEPIALPKGESILSDLMKQFQSSKPTAATKQKNNPFATDLKIESLLGEGQKPRASQRTGFESLTKASSSLLSTQGSRQFDIFSGFSVGQRDNSRSGVSTGLFSTTRTNQSFKLDIPKVTVTKTPNLPSGLYDFGFSPKRESKKGKKKKGQSYGRSFRVTNPLAAVFGLGNPTGKAIQNFGELYDRL